MLQARRNVYKPSISRFESNQAVSDSGKKPSACTAPNGRLLSVQVTAFPKSLGATNEGDLTAREAAGAAPGFCDPAPVVLKAPLLHHCRCCRQGFDAEGLVGDREARRDEILWQNRTDCAAAPRCL